MKARSLGCLGLLGCVVGWVVGCGDPLLERQIVDELRVIGARAEAVNEPERSGMQSGEGARLRWLLVSDVETAYRARTRVCFARESTFGVVQCEGDPWFEASGSGTTLEELVFEFELPQVEGPTPWLAQIALCESGQPRLNSDGIGSCSGDGGVLEATYLGRVGDPEDELNRNPTLATLELELAGELWAAQERLPTGEPCNDLALPVLVEGKQAALSFDVPRSEREVLSRAERDEFAAPEREALLLSHYLTAEGLSRPFSLVDEGARGTTVELDVKLAERPPTEGRIVDFHLVARDGRGGSDWLMRQACARR